MFAHLNDFRPTHIGFVPGTPLLIGIEIRGTVCGSPDIHPIVPICRLGLAWISRFQAKFLRYIVNDFWCNSMYLVCVSSDKCVFANCVDQAGEAAGMTVHG